MSDRPTMRPLHDDILATALRDLGSAIAWPTESPAGPDLATRVAVALRSAPAPTTAPWWRPGASRRVGRGLVLALIALLALAAVAGAVALGLPGLRISLGGASLAPPTPGPSVATPSVSSGPPGADLGLGAQMPLADAAAAVGRIIGLPADPAVGPPDVVYVDLDKGDAVALVWAPTDHLPPTLDPSIGMVLMSFEGTMHEGLYAKLLGSGARLEPVTVGDEPGYWIAGTPHFFFFEGAEGGFVEDMRRWVGEALVWSDGTTTWRLETSLGRDAAIELAESLR